MKKKGILTAATLVAVVLFLSYLQRNKIVFFFIQNTLSQITFENYSLRFVPFSKQQFKLSLLDRENSEIASSLWTVDWLFRAKELEFSGSVFLRDHPLEVKIWIPFPTHKFRGQVTFDKRGLSGKANFEIHQKVDTWVGSIAGKIKHPDFGEASPLIDLESGRKLKLNLKLPADQLKSKYLSLKKEGKLEIRKEADKILGELNLPEATIGYEGLVFDIKRTLIKVPEQKIGKQIRFEGFLQALPKYLSKYKEKSNILFESKFTGDLVITPQFSTTIKGHLKDNLKSIELPFELRKSSNEWKVKAEAKVNLFDGSLAGVLLKKNFPNSKLLGGQAIGKFQEGKIESALKNGEISFGDYRLKKIQGTAVVHLTPLRVNTSRFDLSFAGGSIGISPYEWSQSEFPGKLQFVIRDLEIAELLKNHETSSLMGRGLFDGEGTLAFGAKGFFLKSLSSWNTTPGVVSYSDPSQLFFRKKVDYLDDFQALLKQGQQALVLKALENFHYERVRMSAERDEQEKLKLVLNLKGKNPDLAKGQLFDITLPVEGDIDSLVYGSILQRPITEELNKRKNKEN